MVKEISHYEIIRELEEGGFETTYRVVKHLRNQNTTVFTEAKTHPQIPRLYAYFEEKGKFYQDARKTPPVGC